MITSRHGFTIIELLIVIVVIGTLATIGFVSWSGAVATSRDRAREQDTRQWASTFDLYKGRYVVYPAMPSAAGNANGIKYCLGSFSDYNNHCGQYTIATHPTKSFDASVSSGMLTNVAKVGKVPVNAGKPVDSAFVGPYVYVEKNNDGSGGFNVDSYFINFFEHSCSSYPGFRDAAADNIYPSVSAMTAGHSSINMCYIKKSFNYNPN